MGQAPSQPPPKAPPKPPPVYENTSSASTDKKTTSAPHFKEPSPFLREFSSQADSFNSYNKHSNLHCMNDQKKENVDPTPDKKTTSVPRSKESSSSMREFSSQSYTHNSYNKDSNLHCMNDLKKENIRSTKASDDHSENKLPPKATKINEQKNVTKKRVAPSTDKKKPNPLSYGYNQQGDDFYEIGQLNESEAFYTQAIDCLSKKSSDQILLLNNRADVRTAQSNYEKALEDCSVAIKLAHKYIKIKINETPLMKESQTTLEQQLVKSLCLKARALKGLKRYEEAIKIYKQIITRDKSLTTTMEKHITCCKTAIKEEGDRLQEMGNFDAAEKAYTAVIKFTNDSDLVLLLYSRATTFMMRHEYKECLKYCRYADNLAYHFINKNIFSSPFLDISGDTTKSMLVKVLFLRAKAAESLERYHGAIKIYKKIISLQEEDGTATEGILRCRLSLFEEQGNAYFKNGKIQKAIKTFTNAIDTLQEEHGDLILFLNYRSAAYLDQSIYSKCLEDCEYAIMLIKSEHGVLSLFTTPLMTRKKTTFKDQLVFMLRRKAQVYEEIGKYHEAVQAYKEIDTLQGSVDKDIKKCIDRCTLALGWEHGDECLKDGLFSKAEEIYTRHINILPSDHIDMILLYNKRAVSLMKQHRYDESLEDSKAAILLAYCKKQQFVPIMSAMEKEGTTVEEQLIKALATKAKLLMRLERYEAAIIAWEEITDTHNSSMEISNIRKKIKKCEVLLKMKKEKEEEANLSAGVKELRKREKQRKAEEEERLSKEDEVNTKISNWKYCRENDFKALLESINTILWSEVQVKGIESYALSDPKECKKLYIKIISKIHPDKLPQQSTIEHSMLAKGVFTVLNQSWERFRDLNN